MRSIGLRLAMLAASCLAAFVIVEVALRLLSIAPSLGIASVTETDFDRVPGLLTPGQQLVDRKIPTLPYEVRINNLGYRGADVPRRKAPGHLRILTVGDSFTYGHFVNDDETLPAQLEQELRARCGPTTVINAGVGGTTLMTHHHMIERAVELEPDVVLLMFSENDIIDLNEPLWLSLAENRGAKSSFPLSVVYPVLRQTATWNLLLRVRGRLAARRRPIPAAAAVPPSDADRARQAETVARLRAEYAERLARIRDLVATRESALVYALYPSHKSVLAPEDAEQMRWVTDIGRTLGLRTVSLLDTLRSSGEPVDDLYLLPDDGHPSPRGYAMGARVLASAIAPLMEHCRPTDGVSSAAAAPAGPAGQALPGR